MFLFKGKTKKIGLALGGGGAKGFAHIGVLKAFEELGLKFDCVVGTSVGSIVGAFYCAGYNSEQISNIAFKLAKKDVIVNVVPFMPSKTDGIEALIKDNLTDINIEDLSIPFCAVSVDMKTGKEVNLNKGNLAKSVAGSCAAPLVFNPVKYGDMLLYDGGLLNNIPANVARTLGCDYVIAVDLDESKGTGTNSTKLFDLLIASLNIMMNSNNIKGKISADVLISPKLKEYKATKLKGTQEMLEEGYNAVMQRKEDILHIFKLAHKKIN